MYVTLYEREIIEALFRNHRKCHMYVTCSLSASEAPRFHNHPECHMYVTGHTMIDWI